MSIHSFTTNKKFYNPKVFNLILEQSDPMVPPVLTATGNQLYCPLEKINVVETFTITHDPADLGTTVIYVQISTNYNKFEDRLYLNNASNHPNINSQWNSNTGKLALSSSSNGTIISYDELELAIKDVVFENSSTTFSGSKTFSITLGEANYLASTGHYYLYVPSFLISWDDAKLAAEQTTYFGRKGYLATLTSLEEALLVGNQSPGTGWIGASDNEQEGVWKWVTGPEKNEVFYRGTGYSGTTVTFSYWNDQGEREPNNSGGQENYAHITQPGVGKSGSWNDLRSVSEHVEPDDPYSPKGYIVEFGGMPGDPSTNDLAVSTSIYTPTITITEPILICDATSATLTASATYNAEIAWYDDDKPTAVPIAIGNTHTVNELTSSKQFYARIVGCDKIFKVKTLTPLKNPTLPITDNPQVARCGAGSITLTASAGNSTINWYDVPSGGSVLFTGNSFATPILSETTTFYAEASSGNSCPNSARIPLQAVIFQLPDVSDENILKCKEAPMRLDAILPNQKYLWSTGETSQSIEIKDSGKYYCDITSLDPENCTSRKNFVVADATTPTLSKILVNKQTVELIVLNEIDYFEYSINGMDFQDSNTFENVPSGLHTAYARDKINCNTVTQPFIVIVYPAFFTPNNDQINDIWEVKELIHYQNSKLVIYDRYGKVIITLNHIQTSWDGKFKGLDLPASDYWFTCKLDDSATTFKGHFSLIR